MVRVIEKVAIFLKQWSLLQVLTGTSGVNGLNNNYKTNVVFQV